jgi:hypothetical protein
MRRRKMTDKKADLAKQSKNIAQGLFVALLCTASVSGHAFFMAESAEYGDGPGASDVAGGAGFSILAPWSPSEMPVAMFEHLGPSGLPAVAKGLMDGGQGHPTNGPPVVPPSHAPQDFGPPDQALEKVLAVIDMRIEHLTELRAHMVGFFASPAEPLTPVPLPPALVFVLSGLATIALRLRGKTARSEESDRRNDGRFATAISRLRGLGMIRYSNARQVTG